MPRTDARRNKRVKVICPGCKGETVEATGPVQCIKWIDQASARCPLCGRTWMSQNRVLVERARGQFGEARDLPGGQTEAG